MNPAPRTESISLDPRNALANGAGARLRRRALKERRWAALTLWLGVGIVALVAFVCFAAPLLGFANPNAQNLNESLQPPSLQHPFGTDTLGRDILTRVVYGGRIDLTFAVVMVIIPFALGAIVGTFAGFRGGWLDALVNRLVDLVV